MLGILTAVTLVNWWISASRFGYGLIAIREDEDAAAAMGINTALYKTAAFALSGLAELFNGFIVILVVLFMPKGLADVIRKREFSLRKLARNLREYRV